ncbi:hypothetical protein D8837_08440 [Streptococcus mitis]|uniref:Uncharacterized protein n=1 Tax=Streptococcus mitis TaxID=28037 RepID=A0A3R9L626_STRMT|nr:hypothetical protein D8837_08440 [Streptococcus mitis]
MLAFVGSVTPPSKTASTLKVLDASVSSVKVVAFADSTLDVSLTTVGSFIPFEVTLAATGLAPTAKATPVAKIVAPINLESVRPSLYLRRENFSCLSV